MILPDVNVLIYAFRADLPRHQTCKAWLDKVISGDARFGMSRLVLCAVARIVTNAKIFMQPSSMDEALAYCDSLLEQPRCELMEPGERHWAIFRRLCVSANIRGPRVTDAWFAALAIEHGCTWITCDRDYARFPDLNWREPGP